MSRYLQAYRVFEASNDLNALHRELGELIQKDPETALDLIRQADADEVLKVYVLEGLRRTGDKAYCSSAFEILRGSDGPLLKAEAARALGDLCRPDTLPTLRAHLDGLYASRDQLREYVAGFDCGRQWNGVLQKYQDGSFEKQVVLQRQLLCRDASPDQQRYLQDLATIEILIGALATSQSRLEALKTFQQADVGSNLDLERLLADQDTSVRLLAMDAVIERGRTDLCEQVFSAWDEKDVNYSQKYLERLFKLGCKGKTRFLVNALGNLFRDEGVREWIPDFDWQVEATGLPTGWRVAVLSPAILDLLKQEDSGDEAVLLRAIAPGSSFPAKSHLIDVLELLRAKSVLAGQDRSERDRVLREALQALITSDVEAQAVQAKAAEVLVNIRRD